MKRYRFGQLTGLVFAFYILMGLTPLVLGESVKGEVMTVSKGKEISIEYTLKLEDQTVVDSNVGGKPLIYIHGSKQIISAFEKAMEGMKVGESKQITVKPEEGFGKVDEKSLLEVDKKQIPPDALKIGAQLEGRYDSGQPFTAWVSEIKEETVVLDLNHPLAGKTLYFDVKVLDIQEIQQP